MISGQVPPGDGLSRQDLVGRVDPGVGVGVHERLHREFRVDTRVGDCRRQVGPIPTLHLRQLRSRLGLQHGVSVSIDIAEALRRQGYFVGDTGLQEHFCAAPHAEGRITALKVLRLSCPRWWSSLYLDDDIHLVWASVTDQQSASKAASRGLDHLREIAKGIEVCTKAVQP